MSVDTCTVFEAGPADRDSWARFLAGSPDAEFGHQWPFQDLLAEVFGLEIIRLVARRGDRWVAVLPLVMQKSFLGRFLTSVPYLNYAGVLGDDPAGRKALADRAVAVAQQRGADRLELRGRDGSDLPIETACSKHGYELDLPADSEELWSSIGSKVRSQVKRPRKAGYVARTAQGSACDEFYPLLAQRWHQLGSPILPSRFFRGLERLFSEDMDYVLVEKDNQPVAAGVLLTFNSRVEIPWAASAIEHNRYGVNMLLYWTALERAIERGARRFDYGRSTQGTGTARFKLQWGAREQALSWNVHVGSKKGKASERGDNRRGTVAAIWKRMPSVVAKQLGPLLAARIPL